LKTLPRALPVQERKSPVTIFPGPYGNRSAAQNGTVIQTCKQCGAINQASTERCCFCEALLNAEPAALVSAAAAGTAASRTVVTTTPEWRDEVAHRMRTYRARRNGDACDAESNGPQSALLFDAAAESAESAQSQTDEMDDPLQAALASAATRLAEAPGPIAHPEPRIFERLEIDVSQPLSSLESAPLPANARKYEGIYDPQTEAVYPVASLELRRRAGLIDASFLALAALAIFSVFVALGGRFAAGKLELIICAATVGLLGAQYFTLFTVMGGTTPGMMVTGLRLVTFEGDAPSPGQLMWRSIGYQISAGTAFLGYLWALWDEDNLTWHDRISQTYITASDSASLPDAGEVHSSAGA